MGKDEDAYSHWTTLGGAARGVVDTIRPEKAPTPKRRGVSKGGMPLTPGQRFVLAEVVVMKRLPQSEQSNPQNKVEKEENRDGGASRKPVIQRVILIESS